MVEGRRDILVPSLVVKRGLLDFGMDFLDCRHDQCPEMLWFEDDNLIVVLLPRVMICSATE